MNKKTLNLNQDPPLSIAQFGREARSRLFQTSLNKDYVGQMLLWTFNTAEWFL